MSLYHSTLAWWGSLGASAILRAMSAGVFTPGRFNQAEQVFGEKPDKYSDTQFGKQEWFQLQGVTINLRTDTSASVGRSLSR